MAEDDRDLNKIIADGEKYNVQALAEAAAYELKTVAKEMKRDSNSS